MQAQHTNYSCEKCFEDASELSEGQKLTRCAKCKWAWYCGKDCQVAHWKEHKPNCKPSVVAGQLEAHLAKFQQAVINDLAIIVSTAYFPGLFNGPSQTPTIHFDLSYHPVSRVKFRLIKARLVQRDDFLTSMASYNLDGKHYGEVWDSLHEKTRMLKMDLDPKSPRGRSATIKFIFTAVVADGSSNGKLITPTESWIDNNLRQFSDSSLDPRNSHINWETVVRRHLEGLRRGTAPPFGSYAERTGALAMYFAEGDEEWGNRGDAWVSTSVPLGFSRPVSQSPAVLEQVAVKSPAAVRERLGCLAYAFQQDIEV